MRETSKQRLYFCVFIIAGILTVCAPRAVTQAKNADINRYQTQLSRALLSHDLKAQSDALEGLAESYRAIGDSLKAISMVKRTLAIEREVHDRDGEARSLVTLAAVYTDGGDPKKALPILTSASATLESLEDRQGQASALTATGEAQWALGNSEVAFALYQSALDLYSDLQDQRAEGVVLSDIGSYYWGAGKSDSALNFYNRAIARETESNDLSDEGVTLYAIGLVHEGIGEHQQALSFYQQAVGLEKETGNRSTLSASLHGIGEVYQDLGQPRKALTYDRQALILEKTVGDQDAEATTLTNLGTVYGELGLRRTALTILNRALTIHEKTGNRRLVAITLHDLGELYKELGNTQRALENYSKALPVEIEVGDQDAEARTRWRMALALSANSLPEYFRALSLAETVQDLNLQGQINNSLMVYFDLKKEETIAIYFGKEAVSSFQKIRANLAGLEVALQRSFAVSKGEVYRSLADLLIKQGRLPEAEQVLDLLKNQEYSDYVRSETVKGGTPPSFTHAEQESEAAYQKSTSQLIALSRRWSELKKTSPRSPEQEKEYQQLSDQLEEGSKGLNDYIARLYTILVNDSNANKQVNDEKEDVSLLKQTIAKIPHTVGLYTLVGKDHTSVIVITGSTAVAREYAITEADLGEKVADLRDVMRGPSRDPRPLAQELYKILIAPVKSDLDQAGAETLVWSLDGVLRYVPIAALYDGHQYLVEEYNTVMITPASIPHIMEKPDVSTLSAAAMGISGKYEDGLSALPAVVDELDEVVQDKQVKGANGALPGKILLNEQFTEKAMEEQLGSQHTVVHIASHFVFKPGDDTQSYLLLAGKDQGGAGYHLTVANFRDNQKLPLDDTVLLTLSACETGTNGKASNGREVDGLGRTAQEKGARAVISTLWAVYDASTGKLMGDFYKRWADGAGNVTKAEALRMAQLDLLRGTLKPNTDPIGRGFGKTKAGPDLQSGYAHPYYWAPFVLMGNWQ